MTSVAPPHGHPHRARDRRRLALALALAGAYLVAEVVGGLLANSLALLADAGHMLSDVVALALALLAGTVATRPPTARRTFGYYRAEVLAALANGATLIAVAGWIVVEAFERVNRPPEVHGGILLGIAAGGLLVNGAMLAVLHGGRHGNLNLRGAWLHVLTDTLGSVQALVAGGLILAFDWRWADPIASLAIAVLVVFSAWSLLRETVAILMESVPPHLDLAEIRSALLALGGVRGVHDLHVWTLSSGFVSLSAHIEVDDAGDQSSLWRIRAMLDERFAIAHSTVQIEQSPRPQAITATGGDSSHDRQAAKEGARGGLR